MEVPRRLQAVPVRQDTAQDRAGCVVLVVIAVLPVVALVEWVLPAALLDSMAFCAEGAMECEPGTWEAFCVAAPLVSPLLAVQTRLVALAVRPGGRW
ncbi:hypothetical protein [Streptosporangium saharense]|uniref:hypothetical protein n=1 Tax=Streptosporangium saharense TaxID=1706840 RepID=UPI0034255A61